MTTEELKTFIVLTKVKNFTIAAEQLFIAQSTVTNRISELEKEVGKRLFTRSPKTVKLTESGEIFLRYAERIIDLQEGSIAEMHARSAYKKNFTVGAINATYEAYVKPVLDECLRPDENTTVKLVIGHSLDLIQKLQDEVIDLAFSSIPWKKRGYDCTVFDVDRLVLVTAKGMNAYPKGITEEDLGNIPYLMCNFSLSEIGFFIRSLFPKEHVFKLEVDNSSKLLPFLQKGLGYSFLPYKMVKTELESGELEEVKVRFQAPTVTTYLLHKHSFDPKPVLEYLGQGK